MIFPSPRNLNCAHLSEYINHALIYRSLMFNWCINPFKSLLFINGVHGALKSACKSALRTDNAAHYSDLYEAAHIALGMQKVFSLVPSSYQLAEQPHQNGSFVAYYCVPFSLLHNHLFHH